MNVPISPTPCLDDHFRDEDEPALETLDDSIVKISLALKSDRNRLENIGAHYQKKSLRARRHVVEDEDVFQAESDSIHPMGCWSPAPCSTHTCRDARSLEDRLFDDLGLWNIRNGDSDHISSHASWVADPHESERGGTDAHADKIWN